MPRKKPAGESILPASDEAPELTDDYFETADVFLGEKQVRRGRPPSPDRKQPISLRVDADVLERFRATGPGWQARMNAALRKAIGL